MPAFPRPSGVRPLLLASFASVVLALPVAAQGASSPPDSPLSSTAPAQSAAPAPWSAVGSGPQPATLPSRTVTVPSSIDPTGTENVTRRLQRFIDRTKDRTTIVFPEGAVYRLASGGIRVSGRSRLAFVGYGATLRGEGCDFVDSVFNLGGAGQASSRIIIEGLAIEGDNPAPATATAHHGQCQHAHGIALYRSRHVEVRGVTISNTRGDCLYLSGYGNRRFRWSEDVWFHDSVCQGTGRMGVAITAGEDVRVERSRFTGIAIHVFDIEPSVKEGGGRNILFADNVVGTFGYSRKYGGWLLAADGNLSAMVRHVTLRDNIVTDGNLGVSVGAEFHGWDGKSRKRRDFTITGNMSMVTTAGPVMDFRHVDGLVVTDNVQPLSSGDLAVVADSTDVQIQD